MKRKLLLISFWLCLSVAMPAYGAGIVNYTGLGQITYVDTDPSNPFNDIAVSNYFNWYARYDANVPTVTDPLYHPGWDVLYFNGNHDCILEIPVGSVYSYVNTNDTGKSEGYPSLLFHDGVLKGVDALENAFELSGYTDRLFGFGTIPLFSDFTNFTIVEYQYQMVDDDEWEWVYDKTLVRGDLFVVPEPSTLLLIGVGLMGFLTCFRKKAR